MITYILKPTLLITIIFILYPLNISYADIHHKNTHASYYWNKGDRGRCIKQLNKIKNKAEYGFWAIQCRKYNNINLKASKLFNKKTSFYAQIIMAANKMRENPNLRKTSKEGVVLDIKNINNHLLVHQEIESNHNAKAVSPKGALGIMQIMPATGTMETGLKGQALIDCLMDMRCNQRTAKRHLFRLKRKTDYNLIRILYAYNAGISAEKHYYSRNKGLHPIAYIENIKIRETRNYIKKYFEKLWQRQGRLGLNSESLKFLTQGKYPKYPRNSINNPVNNYNYVYNNKFGEVKAKYSIDNNKDIKDIKH